MNMKPTILAMLALVIASAEAGTERMNRLPLEIHSNEPPILTLEIGGIPVRLRFDLGDRTPLVLQQEVLDAVHAVPTGTTTKMQGLDGVFEVPLFKVAHVKLGTAEFTDVIARLDTMREGYEPDKVTNGFLGSALLKPYQVIINYRARAMTLRLPTAKDSTDLCTGTVVPFATGQEAWNGEAFTEAEIDIGHVILGWDTGAFTSVLRQTLVQVPQPKQTKPILVTNKFVVGGNNFGPKQFEVWDVTLPHFDGFVGNDFFATHVVCIDFPDKQLRVS
jgi:hypothetical protein